MLTRREITAATDPLQRCVHAPPTSCIAHSHLSSAMCFAPRTFSITSPHGMYLRLTRHMRLVNECKALEIRQDAKTRFQFLM